MWGKGRKSIPDQRIKEHPGWHGSVDWVPGCEPKDHWFDSQSRHMPGLGARSLYLSHIDVSLSLFLPPFPSL